MCQAFVVRLNLGALHLVRFPTFFNQRETMSDHKIATVPGGPTTIHIRTGDENPVTINTAVIPGEASTEHECCAQPCCGEGIENKKLAVDGTTIPFQGRALPLNSDIDSYKGYVSINPIGKIPKGEKSQQYSSTANTTTANAAPSSRDPSVTSIHQVSSNADPSKTSSSSPTTQIETRGKSADSVPSEIPAPQAVHIGDSGKLIPTDQYVAMTAYGAIPIPEETMNNIPRHFYTQPIVQERDVFVTKPEICERISEKNYTQYEHNFVEVEASITVDKLVPHSVKHEIEFPRYVYKEYIEEKVLEVPQGVKYTEVPIEVPMQRPPVIVPKEKEYIVERIVHETKPVVQEKIIEQVEIITRRVPKVVSKDIPYVIPRYVEHVIEVPFREDAANQEFPIERGAPETIQSMPSIEESEYVLPAWSEVDPSIKITRRSVTDNASHPQSSWNEVTQQYEVIEDATTDGTTPLPSIASRPLTTTEKESYGLDPTAESPDTVTVSVGKPKFDTMPAEIDDSNTLVYYDEEDPKPHTIFTSGGIKKIKVPYEADIDIEIVRGAVPPESAMVMPRMSEYNGPLPCCHNRDCCSIGKCCNGTMCGDDCCGKEASRKTDFVKYWNAYQRGESLEDKYSTWPNQVLEQNKEVTSILADLSKLPRPDVHVPGPPEGSIPHPHNNVITSFTRDLREKYGENVVYATSFMPCVVNEGAQVGSLRSRATPKKNIKVLTSEGEVKLDK